MNFPLCPCNDLPGILTSPFTPVSGVTVSNQSGQVKVRFTGLSFQGFTARGQVFLHLASAASANVVDAPTTQWPVQSIQDGNDLYEKGFYVDGKLRENETPGQVHRWRVAGNYTGKYIGNQGQLRCFLVNPDTGFRVSSNATLPSGVAEDDFTFEFTSIADNDSLAPGRGYLLGFQTTFTDDNLVVNVNSIVRVSEAIDPTRTR